MRGYTDETHADTSHELKERRADISCSAVKHNQIQARSCPEIDCARAAHTCSQVKTLYLCQEDVTWLDYSQHVL